jgi:nucleoside-diphosphate-sugar epimerase
MAVDAKATAFVAGAGGLLGAELITVLVARGDQVLGFAESVQAAEGVRRAGGLPVIGDRLEPGQWQDEAAADWYSIFRRTR